MILMLLSDVDDPVQAWKYAERYLGLGTKTYSRFAADLDISDAYHPLKAAESFTIPTFWVSKEQGAYLRNGVGSGLHALYRHGPRFLLPVHPEALALPDLHDREELLACPPGPLVDVVPSANARTVFVNCIGGVPVQPHFLKLHYPKRLSRFTRRLRRPIIALQLWVAEELSRIGVPLLSEVAGGVFGHHPIESWGFVVREPRPMGQVDVCLTVPLFALYGRDYHAGGNPTLLEQLVTVEGGSATRWVTERIIRPMVRLWVKVLLSTGCAIELHGQNTLFISSPRSRGRIAYRDSEIYVDPVLREQLGLGADLPPTNVISRDILLPREQVFSLTYDSFMGHHTLDYIAGVMQERFGVSQEALRSAARSEFAAAGGGRLLLPEATFYYDDILHPDGKWRLTPTGNRPVWR